MNEQSTHRFYPSENFIKKIKAGELVVGKDGTIGTPGSFHGEKSFNGNPINSLTPEEFLILFDIVLDE